MDWTHLLIRLYFHVCDTFEAGVLMHTQRYSNNSISMPLAFTDQEAITVYLFGLLQRQRTVKGVYQYAHDHLHSWFPTLPSYQKFNERLNRLNGALAAIAQQTSQYIGIPDWLAGQSLVDAVIDSFPLMMAQGRRADTAKVAREVADKGYCASKDRWYHGIKIHQLSLCQPGRLPLPQSMVLSAASEHDNTVFKEQIAPYFRDLRIYGDKAYHDEAGMAVLQEQYHLAVAPCNQRKKGQAHLHPDQKLFNRLVSQARQPIESFFNWLEQHTGIQCAATVRATTGLYKHVFGALAAALFLLAF